MQIREMSIVFAPIRNKHTLFSLFKDRQGSSALPLAYASMVAYGWHTKDKQTSSR